MTPDDFAAEVRGTLSSWLQGYTDPDATGHQHRVREMASDDPDVDLYSATPVEHIGEDASLARVFRVRVVVEEVPASPPRHEPAMVGCEGDGGLCAEVPRYLVTVGERRAKSTRRLCRAHTDVERRTAAIGMAPVEVLPMDPREDA